jgi:hypothetical protein
MTTATVVGIAYAQQPASRFLESTPKHERAIQNSTAGIRTSADTSELSCFDGLVGCGGGLGGFAAERACTPYFLSFPGDNDKFHDETCGIWPDFCALVTSRGTVAEDSCRQGGNLIYDREQSRAWKSPGATDFWIFHMCDGAGTQDMDCLGNKYYVEQFGAPPDDPYDVPCQCRLDESGQLIQQSLPPVYPEAYAYLPCGLDPGSDYAFHASVCQLYHPGTGITPDVNNLYTASFYNAGNWGGSTGDNDLTAESFKAAGLAHQTYLTFPQDGNDYGYEKGVNCNLWENGPTRNPYLDAGTTLGFHTTMSHWVCHVQTNSLTAIFTGVDNIQCQYDNEPWNAADVREFGATPIVNPDMKGYYFGLYEEPADDYGCGVGVDIIKGNQYDVCGNKEFEFFLCPCEEPPCGL